MVAQTAIGRKTFTAAGVSGAGFVNTFDNPKLGIGSPESAQGKSRCFQIGRDRLVYLWNRDVFHRFIISKKHD